MPCRSASKVRRPTIAAPGVQKCLFVVERLMENGARELGIGAMERRSRNLEANAFPYTMAM